MGKERRRKARYAVPDDEILIPVDFSNNVCKVKYIGWGGVQFEYLAANFNRSHWDQIQIDILSSKNNRSILSKFPCEVIMTLKASLKMVLSLVWTSVFAGCAFWN